MAILSLSTVIAAPRERVFDLSRSIDAHQTSADQTNERAVAGVTTGLIGLNEQVTWEARHFGIQQRPTVCVSAFSLPDYFQTRMVVGAFKRMVHDHIFREHSSGTEMIDRFEFESPLGILGSVLDRIFLSFYMRRFLAKRNELLKALAESKEWHKYLGKRLH